MSIERLGTEAYRLGLLASLERQLWASGSGPVAGVDEVGRGSLAGPVVAAAVVMDPFRPVPGVDDSKCVPVERREPLAATIRDRALACAVSAEWAPEIDRSNVLEATRRAMVGAIRELDPAPGVVAVDAVRLDLPMPCLSFVRGDALSYSIACASIVAKVERDRIMTELGEAYPEYGFGRHKGYGSPEHLEALAEFGPCPEHRLTFRTVVPRRSQEIH